jgi:hypothetical protein
MRTAEETLVKCRGYEPLTDTVETTTALEAIKEYADYYMKESATFQARKDTLEEWLTEYRDELKMNLHDTYDEFVISRRRQVIAEINELLNWEL